MTRENISDAVFDAIEKIVCHEAQLSDTYDTLGLDSLDIVEIVMEVEKKLECGDLVDVVEATDRNANVGQFIHNICDFLGV